jgi:hypothetical protein
MDLRPRGALLLVTLLLGGCATSLREVNAQEPHYTSRGIGTPEAVAHCVQDYLEEHFGGIVVGRLAGLVYEVRREDTASYLIGRVALAPSDVLFALALTPIGTNELEAQLRMDTWRPWQKSAKASRLVCDRDDPDAHGSQARNSRTRGCHGAYWLLNLCGTTLFDCSSQCRGPSRIQGARGQCRTVYGGKARSNRDNLSGRRADQDT